MARDTPSDSMPQTDRSPLAVSAVHPGTTQLHSGFGCLGRQPPDDLPDSGLIALSIRIPGLLQLITEHITLSTTALAPQNTMLTKESGLMLPGSKQLNERKP